MARHPAGKAPDLHALAPDDAVFGPAFCGVDPPVFDDYVHEVMAELAALLISKQADYGPHAINRAPGGPTLGVLVRAHDKLERLAHLTSTPRIVNNESIRDSWVDLANYAVIGLLVHDGRWPRSDAA